MSCPSPVVLHATNKDSTIFRFFNDFLEEMPVSFWHSMRSFYDGDAYPSLGLYFQFIDVVVGVATSHEISALISPQFVTVFGGIAKLFVEKKPSKIE